MSLPQGNDIALTTLLQAWQAGDGVAFSQVFEQVYDQLKKIAAYRLREVAGNSTLSPTELLHEAVLRVSSAPTDWTSRAHFFASMSLVLRATLVDHARAQATQKRGGEHLHVTLTNAEAGEDSQIADLLALDQALEALQKLDARSSEVLHLTYFAGLEGKEIAAVLGTSLATVNRELRFARAWLNSTLGYAI
jgi:RNA polymerase sigma factor (TIGR02999 family)